jgi:mannose-6-phosphate isomerase
MTGHPIEQKHVDKPWGRELWWAMTEHYSGKLLYVDAGHRLSLQFHERKDETSYLLAGRLRVHQGVEAGALEEWVVEPGESWRNEPGVVHTITALEDSVVIEVSTPHLDDVVRIDDRYGRAPAPGDAAG